MRPLLPKYRYKHASACTRAISRQQPSVTSHAATEEILEAVFSIRSVPRLYSVK
jgi:hypothetical protein